MQDLDAKYEETVLLAAAHPGVVLLLGAVDTGKTTVTRRAAASALGGYGRVALVDADLGQSSIGPPTTVGLAVLEDPAQLEPGATLRHDALAFVGSDSPRGHSLSLAIGIARMVDRARELGAEVTIVDTCGFVAGIGAQRLKLSIAELVRPRAVIALQQGEELEPVVGVIERFVGVDVHRLAVHPSIRVRSVDERIDYRQERLGAYLGSTMNRWRVKPTVFMPTLPPGLDLTRLHGLLCGIDDGAGDCLGIGILEYLQDGLRLQTPVAEGVKALRLGSVRVEATGRITAHEDLRVVLGTD